MTSLVTFSDSATNANAFASTFAFSPTQQPTQKKAKELASQRTGHRRQLCKLHTTTLRTDRRATDNKGFAIAGVPFFADTFVVSGSSVLRMKFSAKNPRHRKPPKRYN